MVDCAFAVEVREWRIIPQNRKPCVGALYRRFNLLSRIFDYAEPPQTLLSSWAAGNGDRSENGDYIYGKKRLREIDRRIHYLTKQLGNAEIIDPKRQQNLTQVFFGATVSYLDQNQHSVTIKLVGVGKQIFLKAKSVGDLRSLKH